MAEDPSEKLSEGKLDLVPMIDCIMLLLLFFILTTKFSADEKAIASLLPTDKGQNAAPPSAAVTPPKNINICIYPENFVKGFGPADYLNQYDALKKQVGDVLPNAYLRIGGEDVMLMSGKSLSKKDAPDLKQNVDQIHAYIHAQLAQRENPTATARKEQDPVVIHSFSGMSWKFALVAYDAVRAYEAVRMGAKKMSNDPAEWANAREVSFAPPRLRNYSATELGNELYEIVNMQ